MDKLTLMTQLRQAERLRQRTARMYRHLQAAIVFWSVIGCAGAATGLFTTAPSWIWIAGAVILSTMATLTFAIRPADKATAQEEDARRYAQLRTAGHSMDAVGLESALRKVRERDVPEIHLLRDVVYNDVVAEIGRPEKAVQLTRRQKLLGALA